MAQNSYGTITITDTTDITDVYLIYALALSTASENDIKNDTYLFNHTGERGWDSPQAATYPTWTSGYQIWVRKVREYEGIVQLEYGTPYLDTAVNQLNTRISSSETNITALQTKLKRIWINEITNGDYVAGTYAASGINGTTFVESNPQTYGYNTLLRHNALDLRYNTVKMTSLTTAALTFYIPTQDNNNNWIQGNKGLELSADGLKFFGFDSYIKTTDTVVNALKSYYTRSVSTPYIYTLVTTPTGNPSTNNYYELEVAAELTSAGLKLIKGGIIVGAYNSSIADSNQNFVYLSSQDYGTGIQIGNSPSDKADWRQIIGNKFGVDKAGNLYASNANISGTIAATSGTIGGWTIDGLKLYTGFHDTYDSSEDGLYLGQVSNDYFISGGPEAQWYLKSDGTGRIGELTITKEVVGGDTIFTATIPAMNITGKLKATQIETDFITLGLDEAIEGTITYVYEHYVLTTDTAVQQGKTYYNRTGSAEPYTYVAVDNPSGNPQTSGWYEVISETVFKNNVEDTYYYLTISSTYVLTTDTEVQDKIYYSRTGSAEPYTYVAVNNPSSNPQASNYYERIDEEIETNVEIDKLKRNTTTDELITNRMEDGINTSIDSLSTQTNFLQGRVQEINNITVPLNDKVNTHLIEESEGNALSLKVSDSVNTFLRLNSSGIYLYSDSDSANPIAKYGTDVILGKTSENHIKLSSNNGLQFISFHNEEVASFNSDVLMINQAEIKNMLQISDFRWSTSNKTISGTSYKRVSFVYSPQLTEE